MGKEKRSWFLLVGRLEWLADQEVVAAADESKTDADDYQSDQHGSHPCGIDDPVISLSARPMNANASPETVPRSSLNTARSVGLDVTAAWFTRSCS